MADPRKTWLTSYELWDHVTTVEEAIELIPSSNATILFRVARDRGVPLEGIATERRIGGALVFEPPDDGVGVLRVYTGKFNTFQQLTSHPILSILPDDKAYEHTETS